MPLEKTPYEEQLELFERQKREQEEQARQELERQKQRIIDEFNANPDNIPDQSVYTLPWHYDVWYPYFKYEAVAFDGVGLEVFKYINLDYANYRKVTFHDWGYTLVRNDPDDPGCDIRDARCYEWNDKSLPHYATVTEAIKAAQDAAVVYLEAQKQEFDEAIAKLKGKGKDNNNTNVG